MTCPCDVTVTEQNCTNLLSNVIWMFVSLFTERKRLQRQICSSSSALKTADWRVGSISVWCYDFTTCTFVTSPPDVTVQFGSLNKFWVELSRCSVSLNVCFCVCVIWTLSFLHQRVRGCSVAPLTWRSRGSSGRRGGARSDRYTSHQYHHV